MIENNITGEMRFFYDGKNYTLSFQRYYVSDQIEKVKVFGKERELHMQSDRPWIIGQKKKVAAKWKVIGTVNIEMYKHPLFIQTLIYHLETELDKFDNPKPQNFQEYRNKSW